MKKLPFSYIANYVRQRRSHSDYRRGGWYMIKNIKNGKSYIGKSIEPVLRLRQHLFVSSPKTMIDKEIRENGFACFEFYILDVYANHSINFFSRKKEISIEKALIENYETRYPNGYNIR